MKSLLDQIEPLDSLISQLQKIDSKLRQGQIIDAWRDLRGIQASLEKHKKDLVSSVDEKCENE